MKNTTYYIQKIEKCRYNPTESSLYLFKIDKILQEIYDKCNRIVSNAAINNQKVKFAKWIMEKIKD